MISHNLWLKFNVYKKRPYSMNCIGVVQIAALIAIIKTGSLSNGYHDVLIVDIFAKNLREILLNCDQSNILLVRIIFSCIFLSAFSFLSTCVRDPASI